MSPHTPRVAVTRDEPLEGRLSSALRSCGLEPVVCRAVRHVPTDDPWKLRDAARHLERYDWLVIASRRALSALMGAGEGARLPAGLRTAAVGSSTAAALVEFGAAEPLTTERSGAEALAEALRSADDWSGKRVLMPRAEEGSRVMAETLAALGAEVEEIEAYRTVAVEPERLAGCWLRTGPQAVVLASPSAARSLVDAIGVAMLNQVVVAAIGPTTAAALAELGVPAHVPERADFAAAAELLARCLGVRSTSSGDSSTQRDRTHSTTSEPGGVS